MDLMFKTCRARNGYQGAFVAEHNGYLCFLEPVPACFSRAGHQIPRLTVHWSIQQGGGWTFRGGPEVETLADGIADSIPDAETYMKDWLDQHSQD